MVLHASRTVARVKHGSQIDKGIDLQSWTIYSSQTFHKINQQKQKQKIS